MQNTNSITVNQSAAAWAVGGVGIAVGLVSLALIWTTRDMWAVLQRENAFNLARITLLEADLGRAEQELRTQKAYIDRYMTERGNQ